MLTWLWSIVASPRASKRDVLLEGRHTFTQHSNAVCARRLLRQDRARREVGHVRNWVDNSVVLQQAMHPPPHDGVAAVQLVPCKKYVCGGREVSRRRRLALGVEQRH